MYDISKLEEERMASRLLNLLDQAYEAAENPHAMDDFITSIDRFFFPRSANTGLASDIEDAQPLTDTLDRHLNRLQSLIDQNELDASATSRIGSGPQLANLVISEDGLRAIGNSAALEFFNCKFPTSLAGLCVTEATRKAIRTCLSDLCEGVLEGSRVIKIEREVEESPYLARCTKIQSRSANGEERRGLTVMVNHIDWQTDALDYAAATFGLTPAELALLRSLLDGKSHHEAAEELGKSRETIKAQAKSILRKSGMCQMPDVLKFMTSYAFLAEPKPPATAPEKKASTLETGEFVIRLNNGRQIQINRYGLMGGRPILFFHGLYQGPFFTPTLQNAFKERGYDVIAPSRPGFNRTDAPDVWANFNQTVTDDVVDVLNYFDIEDVDFVVHHAGISFACRAGWALGQRALSAVMVGAGVPIKDYMLKTMNVESRIAGAAVKYAPKVLDMMLRVGVARWRRQGAYAYLSNMFASYPADHSTLDDPEMGPIMERGIHHMISQGAATIMHDGASAMSDWEPEYKHLPERQLWLHGDKDPVMNHKFVQDFLLAQSKDPPHIYEGRGGDVLLVQAKDVVRRIDEFIQIK